MKISRAGKISLLLCALCLLLLVVYCFLPRPEAAVRLRPLPESDTVGGVNINRATAEELDALPGIGPALAAAIVEQRDSEGVFSGPEDVLAVKGIGEAKWADIEPYIIFGETE